MRKLFYLVPAALLLIALILIYNSRTQSEVQNKVVDALSQTLSEYETIKFTWKDSDRLYVYIHDSLGETDDEALGMATKLVSEL